MILYSTGCPKCKVLEMKLAQAGVSFDKITDEKKMEKLGFQSAPMLEHDGRYLDFHDAMDLVDSIIEEQEDANQPEIG